MATLPGGLIRGLDAEEPKDGLFRGKTPNAMQGPSGPAITPSTGLFRGHLGNFIRPGDAAIVVVTTYEMRAEDANCMGTPRYWTVNTTPDYAASLYSDTFCGVSKNFTNVHVALVWFTPVT